MTDRDFGWLLDRKSLGFAASKYPDHVIPQCSVLILDVWGITHQSAPFSTPFVINGRKLTFSGRLHDKSSMADEKTACHARQRLRSCRNKLPSWQHPCFRLRHIDVSVLNGESFRGLVLSRSEQSQMERVASTGYAI